MYQNKTKQKRQIIHRYKINKSWAIILPNMKTRVWSYIHTDENDSSHRYDVIASDLLKTFT